MNTNRESKMQSAMNAGADEPKQNNGFQAKEEFEDQREPAENKEDIKFVSELGWLTAASITIASVAQSIGIS